MNFRIPIFLLVFALLPALSWLAETSYTGTLSGVECTACKKTIARALGKLKGVKTIRIVKIKNGETHRLEVVTDGSSSLSKSDVTTALKKAEHYKILTWGKSKQG